MKPKVLPYYADERKYFRRTKNPLTRFRTDKEVEQFVHVTGSIFGIEIRLDKCWTKLCDKLFRETKANAVRLESAASGPDGSLEFINGLPQCTRVAVDDGLVDLSPLNGNARLEDLQLGSTTRPSVFDLSTFPNLRRCRIPLVRELDSFERCQSLVCLALCGGRASGTLDLTPLRALKEFICINVRALKDVRLNREVRLRSLELSHLRDLETVIPADAITADLRVVELNKVPKLPISWLAEAASAQCIALRLGEIPSIRFLSGLKRLQVLDLFGTKVKDGDLTFRDSLKNELDSELWSTA